MTVFPVHIIPMPGEASSVIFAQHYGNIFILFVYYL